MHKGCYGAASGSMHFGALEASRPLVCIILVEQQRTILQDMRGIHASVWTNLEPWRRANGTTNPRRSLLSRHSSYTQLSGCPKCSCTRTSIEDGLSKADFVESKAAPHMCVFVWFKSSKTDELATLTQSPHSPAPGSWT